MKPAKKESRKALKTKAKKPAALKPARAAAKRGEDVQQLVHLFRVNLIELEHQNQELRITEEELEASRSKYVNLFDFSPIPYFTLDQGGTIKEVNLNACNMFGVDRNKLVGKNIGAYVPIDEKTMFSAFLKSVFKSPAKQSCKLRMMSKDKRIYYVLLEGVRIDDVVESDQRCQIALIDLTEYKRLEDSFRELSEELRSLKAGGDKVRS